VVLGEYSGVVRTAIIALKHGRRDDLADPLGHRLAAASIGGGIAGACDGVTSVPSHPVYRMRRGYCAAELVARRVASVCRLPHLACLRRRGLSRQATRTRAERLRLATTSFRARRSLAGRRILLVDDVTTTGTTLRRAVEALHEAGARDVYCAVLARAPDPRRV
jgi:predicted amidophosphoribosyltransferase